MQLVFWGLGVLWLASLFLATPLPAARLGGRLLLPRETLLPLHKQAHAAASSRGITPSRLLAGVFGAELGADSQRGLEIPQDQDHQLV
jgi:hypothetical protein